MYICTYMYICIYIYMCIYVYMYIILPKCHNCGPNLLHLLKHRYLDYLVRADLLKEGCAVHSGIANVLDSGCLFPAADCGTS